MIKNADFTKIDNMRAKIINNPSTGNIFDTSMKRDTSNKILYKNIQRQIFLKYVTNIEMEPAEKVLFHLKLAMQGIWFQNQKNAKGIPNCLKIR